MSIRALIIVDRAWKICAEYLYISGQPHAKCRKSAPSTWHLSHESVSLNLYLYILAGLPMRQRTSFKMLCIAHKTLHNTGPYILRNRIKLYAPVRNLRSQATAKAVTTRIKLSRMGGRAFSHLAAKCWNDLPIDLRCTDCYLTFRKKLKTALFPK